jgi:hypothetical protein
MLAEILAKIFDHKDKFTTQEWITFMVAPFKAGGL